MVSNARFPQTAYWQVKKIVDDGDKIGADTKAVPFRCVESTLKNKTVSTSGDGATASSATLALRTDEFIAKQIEPDDVVQYLDYSYSVSSVTAVRSIVGLGAKEYIINLK